MIQDTLKVTGNVQITVFDAQGAVKDSREIHNLVVSGGRTFIAASMLKTTSNSPVAMTHMALGTGNTAAALTNTGLGVEAGRVALSGASSNGAVVSYTANFPAGTATGAITEAGIFNAATGGTMLCRTVFPVVNKGAGDAVSITWTVTVS